MSIYIGNKCATFPLQLLGFDVDPLNTVQFSNHSGYKLLAGQRLTAEDVGELIGGLKANELFNYSHVLTGYNGSPESLKTIANTVRELRAKNPSLIYVCDPVMGDAGVVYVSTDVIPIYRDILLPIADVITPNQFEVELLMGRSLKTETDISQVLNELHDIGPRYIVISSAELENAPSNTMYLFGSERQSDTGKCVRFKIGFPKLNGSFTGTGDLFAALLLARLDEISREATSTNNDGSRHDNNTLARACQIVLGSMTRILTHTLSYQRDIPPNAPMRGDSAIARACELRLIECRNLIESVFINLKIEAFDE
ncbi:protein F57C9.1, isoform c [Syncephalis fuscata]|nr:protein F57C9.1, isoform c [Syncephalis fuscata]